MNIQIDPHTLERAEERGTNEDEIKDVVNAGFTIPANISEKARPKFMNLKERDTANIMSKSEWR